MTALHANTPDSLAAAKAIEKMVEAISSGDGNKAVSFRQEALRYCQKNDNLAHWQEVWIAEGKSWRDQRKSPIEALAAYRKGLQGWRQPTSEREWVARCRLHLGEGYIHNAFFNDYSAAIAAYEAAYQYFTQKTNGRDASVARFIFILLGNIYSLRNETDRAVFLFQKGIEYGKQSGLPDLVADGFNSAGLALKNANRFQEASHFFKEGMRYSGVSAYYKFLLQVNLGLNLHVAGDNKAALIATHAAEKNLSYLYKTDPEEAAANRPYLLENYGLIYAAEGKHHLSHEAFEESIRLQLEQNGGSEFSHNLSNVYIRYAHSVFKFKGDVKTALELYHSSLKCLFRNVPEDHSFWLPSASDLFPEFNIIEALEGKAACFLALYEDKPDQALLQKALACHELMAKTEDLLREGYQFEAATVSFMQESEKRATEAIALTHRLWSSSGDITFLEKGFWFNERTKSLRLVEELRRSRLAQQNLLPKADMDKLRDFRNSLAYYEQELETLKNEENAATLKALAEKIFNLKQEQGVFEKRLRSRHPEWAGHTDTQRVSTAAEALAALPARTAMLSYAAEADALYVFILAKPGNTMRFEKIDAPVGWPQMVADYHAVFSKTSLHHPFHDKKESRFVNAGKLYELLLAKPLGILGKGIERLVILPDHVIGYVPFEALHPPINTSLDIPKPSYLLERYAVSYAYSASLLREQRLLPLGERAPNLFAAFAPKYNYEGIAPADTVGQLLAMLVRDGAYDLVGAQEEAHHLAKLYKGEVFGGELASESAFLENAPKFRILHLAMHSLTNNEQPQFSHLLFSRNRLDSLYDGNLTSLELNNLQLRAELVVLSACNTGYGKLHRGEGIMSLARSFALAGTPAVVMSLWKVDDQATRDLMVSFYGHLKKGMAKDEALRQAKLDYLAAHAGDELLSDPYFWAGFVGCGDMRPLDMGHGVGWARVSLAGAALLTLALGLRLLWKRKSTGL